MPAALLAIVVAAGEAATPGSRALLASAAESLAPAVSVRMLESPEPGEAEGLRVERELAATAVVVLSWSEPAHLHALLQVHIARSDRWTVRRLAFSREDTFAQRGRTLGLAAASMFPQAGTAAGVPSRGPEPPPPRESAPAPEPTSTPAKAPLPPATMPAPVLPTADAAERRPELHRAPAASDVAATPRSASPTVASVVASRRRLGVSATAAAGVGGPATGFGGAVEGLIGVASNVGLRFATSLRAGPIAALPGTHFVASLAGGLEWWGVHAGRWSLSLRGDVLLLRHQVTRTASGEDESSGRFVPGADLVAATTLRLASGWEALVGVGAELAWGTTEIRDGTAHVVVATIPALRAIAQAGFRIGF